MNSLSVDPRAKALIFDLDGTLVDSMPMHFEALKEICSNEGFDFSEMEFYELAGVSTERIFEIMNDRHGTEFEPQKASALKEAAYRKRITLVKPIAPVLKLAMEFHGKLPMSIGTGSIGEHSWEVVRALGLDQYFDILVSKNDVSKGKPHPETFLKCAEAMRVDPKYCQVFEDGDPGLQAARSAGMIATDVRGLI